MLLMKPFTNKQYAELAIYCNNNNCHIEDRGDFVESVENEKAPEPTYQEKRRAEYPLLGEQLDMIWHAIDKNELDKTSDFYLELKKVKDKYPKEVLDD